MNELLLMEDLKGLNNVIRHEGRKGQRWGIFGASGATRFQPGAVYAKGMANPNAEKDKKATGMKARELVNAAKAAHERKKDQNAKEQLKKRGSTSLDKAKEEISKAKNMSTEDLREATNRMRAERDYNDALQNRMQSEMNLAKLESQYRDAFTTPKKQNFAKKTFDRFVNKASDALVDTAVNAGKNYVTAKAHELVKNKFGEDVANTLFNVRSNNGNNKGQNNQNKSKTGQELDRLNNQLKEMRDEIAVYNRREDIAKAKQALDNIRETEAAKTKTEETPKEENSKKEKKKQEKKK